MTSYLSTVKVKIFTRPCKYCQREVLFDSRIKSKNNTLIPLNANRTPHDHPDLRGILKKRSKLLSATRVTLTPTIEEIEVEDQF